MNNFDIFRFKPFINEALTAKGFKQPTEVQERLIPLIAKGKKYHWAISNWYRKNTYVFVAFV